GQKPFPGDRPPLEELLARQHETPVPPRQVRPDIPLELETVICQMMARDPSDRYPTPLALITALSNFLESPTVTRERGLHSTLRSTGGGGSRLEATEPPAGSAPAPPAWLRARRVLVVSSNATWRGTCRSMLESQGLTCSEASANDDFQELLEQQPAD